MLQVLIIGQSPRPDLEGEIRAAVPGMPFRITGALDGLARAELDPLRPQDGADTLFTVLPNGETITVSKKAVTTRLQMRLAQISGPTLLACTGTFHGIPERPDLVQPSPVLNALAEALLPRGRLGLFLPLSEQLEALGGARRRDGVSVQAVPLRPHSDDAARDSAAQAMAAQVPDLVLLDCISYSRRDKAAVAARLSCPVLLSVAVAARTAACLLGEA
jgi:protein AroM